MRSRRRTWALLALAVCLCLSHPAPGTETELPHEPKVRQQGSRSDREPQEQRGPSCLKLCLADGEDPMDCRYYCIQVACGPSGAAPYPI